MREAVEGVARDGAVPDSARHDGGLARRVGGTGFRRADTARDERAADPPRPVADFLRGLAGWLPPEHETRRSVARLKRAVDAAAAVLADADDATVADGFARSVRRLHASARLDRDVTLLAPVFAAITVACRRRLGLDPHPVQLAGARALLGGRLAEMPTGEGKTLVAAIAATAMAGSGAAVHVISTNDYLAGRDAAEMAPLYAFFGIGCGSVQGGMSPAQRRAAYACRVCYAAGKEVVFDYLKDRLAGHGVLPARIARLHDLLGPQGAGVVPLIPALHFAIVDEADSVMIDEARTPMILSQPAPSPIDERLLQWAVDAARRLRPGRDFRIGAGRDLDLLPGAADRSPAPPDGVAPGWRSHAWREQLLKQAAIALHCYHRDQHYIVSADGKVQIVDESTGRVMPDRSWEQGLHQMIELKEALDPTRGRETLARMTYQRFFRRYYAIAGLTGTATEAARELWSVYGLRVRRIPPNRPKRLARLPDRCFASTRDKWAAVADAATARAAAGQPVLIGTRSVQASEEIGAELARRGVAHVVLNARQDAEEAAIIADAGASGRITVATNMAGRGTDIKPDARAIAAGGLHVVLTEFHESPRVDRQLFGRSARQGEPGSAQAMVAADDALFERTPLWLRRLMSGRGAVARRMLRGLVARKQAAAEGRALRVRLQTLQADKELHRLIGFAGRVT